MYFSEDPFEDLYSCNFFPPHLATEDELDPVPNVLTFFSGSTQYTLRKIRVSKQLTTTANFWFSELLRYLRVHDYEIPAAPDSAETFISPKKTCKSSSVSSPCSAVPVRNTFAVLAPPPAVMDTSATASPPDKPRLVFKRNIPPISIKTSDPSALDKLRSVLHQDTIIHYQPDRLRFRASSVEEYKEALDFVNAQQWEFFTFNPVVLDSAKSVLRGLPPSTPEEDIKQALQDKGICVLQVRQLWKSSQSSEGVWTKTPLSIWYISHSKTSSTALRALVGLLHFRIRWEDPKKRDSLPQCFRCLEFGHHANFCKQQVRCRTCAETHDSRECPVPTSHPPKCHNCQGDHLASSKDCPHRQRLLTSVRRPSIPKPPPTAEFPPLRHTSPTLPVSSDSSTLLDFVRLLSSPEAREVITLLSTILRNCMRNPSILRNIATFLSAFN